jgi:dephospho-CoA kinase
MKRLSGNRPFVIGITGGFGTGKSFVASLFRNLGGEVLDADRIAHAAIRKTSPAYKKIVRAFGEGVLDSRRNIDRRKLAEVVFESRVRLKALNRIVHPIVIAAMKKRMQEARPGSVIVLDVPLLVEAGLAPLADRLVVVKASRSRSVARAMRKFRITKGECMKRIRNQMPLKEKVRIADFIIDNDGTRKETERQVRKIWRKIAWI